MHFLAEADQSNQRAIDAPTLPKYVIAHLISEANGKVASQIARTELNVREVPQSVSSTGSRFAFAAKLGNAGCDCSMGRPVQRSG